MVRDYRKKKQERKMRRSEEPGIVLKGKLELTLDRNACILEAGDAFYFDSRAYLGARNVGEGEAEVISVNTPPSF